MARRKFKRLQETRLIGKSFLIFCEGSKTEVNYFESIRTHLRKQTVQITVVHPSATDPESIVKSLIGAVNERKQSGMWIQGDLACAVFDGDEHFYSNPDNWNRAISLAQKHEITLGISNPSFELWFLLHFVEQTASIHRSAATTALKVHIPTYQKSGNVFPDPLLDKTPLAIARARSLRTRNEQNFCDKYYNPCTHVDEIVASLFE